MDRKELYEILYLYNDILSMKDIITILKLWKMQTQ